MNAIGPISYIPSDIIGGIAIMAQMDRAAVESAPCDVEWSSSNPNNWIFAVHLPERRTAIVSHDGPGSFEIDPMVFEIRHMADVFAESDGAFNHPELGIDFDKCDSSPEPDGPRVDVTVSGGMVQDVTCSHPIGIEIVVSDQDAGTTEHYSI